ncbi:MAG TPA: tRNA lysidine(34) synthetase TilS [Pyrinomonadaceae bacterium]|nr:tRNA lysidine(34) synthetase TilS [Pyrinomonadaceae bacterium]
MRGKNSRLNQFARLLMTDWRRLRLPLTDERAVVAVSGGADSTALLLALDELISANKLRIELCVAHLDHRLRESSAKDSQWVKSLAKSLGYDVVIGRSKVLEEANDNGDNLEQAARIARYKFLERTASRKKARYVLTGHTMDDQAETVLMRLMRGSSSAGLSGMEPIRPLKQDGEIKLVRPLLWARRAETEAYCRIRRVAFRSDEMNFDEQFSRVKVRKHLLPLMQTFNSKVVEALSRTATLLKEDATALFDRADELLRHATVVGGDQYEDDIETVKPALNVDVLSAAPAAVRRRALRQWISEARGGTRRLEMVHLIAVEKLLEGRQGGRIAELPGGLRVRRRKNRLEFEAKTIDKAGRKTV